MVSVVRFIHNTGVGYDSLDMIHCIGSQRPNVHNTKHVYGLDFLLYMCTVNGFAQLKTGHANYWGQSK